MSRTGRNRRERDRRNKDRISQEQAIQEKHSRREMRKQKKEREKVRKNPIKAGLGWLFQIIVVILFAYIAVFFFGQSRTNIGQAMNSTLSGGDVVLLNELSYRFSGPSREDVISFKLNGSEDTHSYIRRVIGLPGETIQIIDGMIYINGSVYLETQGFPQMENAGMAAQEITLGEDEYFVLGDNRNQSEDSRNADIGNVKKEDIKFVPGDRVKISAHVQYSKQENNEETEYLKTLVIDEMETADSTEQDVFDLDEVGQEDVNKGMFVGRVVHMFDVPKKDNLKIVTLSIRSQGFLNYVDISAFDEFADMLKDVKNDDYLAVIAEVRTRKSLNDRMNLSNKLQNIVCIKMKKVPADNIEK